MTNLDATAHQVIRTKRDVRSYSDQPIAPVIVDRILQAGRLAGTAKHGQWCRAIVVEDAAQRAALAACGDATGHLLRAPLVVAIVTLPYEGKWDPDRATAFDAGRAAQNMMLAAWADGITSCPATMHREADANHVLGLPDGVRVAITLAFGYPATDPERQSRPRLAAAEFAYRDRWGAER